MQCQECGGSRAPAVHPYSKDMNKEDAVTRHNAYDDLRRAWTTSTDVPTMEGLRMVSTIANLAFCFRELHFLMTSGAITDTWRAFDIGFSCESKDRRDLRVPQIKMLPEVTVFAEACNCVVITCGGLVYLVTDEWTCLGQDAWSVLWSFRICASHEDGSFLMVQNTLVQ